MKLTEYKAFITELKQALIHPLPGSPAHDLAAPEHRKSLILQKPDYSNAQLSSVLILFFPDKNGDPNTVFIKRVEYKGVHSGQVSFPGGKEEKEDKDQYETAYRELYEEIGVSKTICQTLGKLTELYVPPSNFIIYPIVAATDENPVLKMDPREVAEIITVPFDFFFKTDSLGTYLTTTSEMLTLQVPGYMVNNHLIWGATAMILSELLLVAKETTRYKGK